MPLEKRFTRTLWPAGEIFLDRRLASGQLQVADKGTFFGPTGTRMVARYDPKCGSRLFWEPLVGHTGF